MAEKIEALVERKAHILVIDDEAGPRQSLRMVLGKEYDCFLAESGGKGLEVLSGAPIDLVILDIKMPGMDGIETLKRIREMNTGAEVVMLTGHGTLETAKQAIRHGAFDYVSKPFDLKEMREIIRRGLDRKFARDMTHRQNRELEELLSNVQEEVSGVNRLAQVGQISAGVVHQMKNPLTVILGYTQMLENRLEQEIGDGKMNEDSYRYLSIIQDETVRCAEMAKKLLKFSRNAVSEEVSTFITALLKDIEILVLPHCTVNKVIFRVIPPISEVRVKTLYNDLHEVLLNLCFNAIDAMPCGGELEIAACDLAERWPLLDDDEKRFVKNSGKTDFVAIEIKDTGSGIPESIRDKIFESFFTTKAPSKGTGLGLAICREKMEKNGGTINIAETGPGGSTFRVILPVE